MLVLTRRDGESLEFECSCGCITRVIVRTTRGAVKIAVAAPPAVKIRRTELTGAMKRRSRKT